MNRTASIVKKFLMSQPFFEDGFEYQFISVEPDSDWAIKFTANVLLPKKGHLYILVLNQLLLFFFGKQY